MRLNMEDITCTGKQENKKRYRIMLNIKRERPHWPTRAESDSILAADAELEDITPGIKQESASF